MKHAGTKINGFLSAETNTGAPYAGGAPISIEPGDIVAVGKLRSYGSFVIQFMVRLRDGRMAFVNASKQEPDVEKWFRRIARKIRIVGPGRDEGWCEAWMDLEVERGAGT